VPHGNEHEVVAAVGATVPFEGTSLSDRTQRTWLLVTVSTGPSSTLRVHAWRRLRSLGALYLQNSICLLPALRDTERLVARLVDRVRREGGTARVLRIALLDAAEEAAVIAEFSRERTDEYGEICSRAPALLDEIEMERKRGRATYAEVEESEADLERLKKWLGRVKARDYFGAEGAREAEAAVDQCAAVLAVFEAEALASELPEADP
jgi:Protein ChrB, N-terminal